MKKAGISSTRIGVAAAIHMVVLWMAVSWNPAQGADTASPDTRAPLEQPWFDSGHDFVSDRLQRAAIWLDGFFGDPRVDTQTDASAYLHVVFDAFYSGVEDESENGIKFRGGVDLPRLDERLRLLITSDADAAVTGRDLAGTARDEINNTDGAVGLRYLFRDRPNSKFSLGGGLSGGLSPEVLLAARHVYTKPWTETAASHITSTLYWKSDDGPGVSTLLDYEWLSGADTLWRYTLFGNYREETHGVEWSTQAKWARRLSDSTAINVRAGVHGATEPTNILTEGWLKFLYRRNAFRSWLFYELEPGLSWHHRANYNVEPTIALRLELQFRRR